MDGRRTGTRRVSAPLGSAILTGLGPGQIAVTSDLTLNYLRPMFPSSGLLSSRARPIEVGRRLGLAEAVMEDGSGKAMAHSTTRCFIQSLPVPDEDIPSSIDEPAYGSPDPYERPLTTGAIPPDVWATKTFLEICDMLRNGDLPTPPFVELFGMSSPIAKEGYFESTAPSSPWFTSPAGTIYGGFLAYFVDSVLSGAVNTVLPPNTTFASLDLKVRFLRPVMPDGRSMTASASVIHRGTSLVVAERQIVNADGKVVVRATSSAVVMEGRSWVGAVIDEAEVLSRES